MENIDYHNFDKLEIYAKKDKVNMIISCYEAFSWTLFSKEENAKYEDTYNLTFTRPHKIKNKDFLQYHQIEMDNTLNKIGKIEKNKHSKSTIFGLIFGILLISLIASSVLLLKTHSVLNYILAGIVITLSVIDVALNIIFIPKIYKKENEKFNKQNKLLHDNLTNLCNLANTKKGETDEKC